MEVNGTHQLPVHSDV